MKKTKNKLYFLIEILSRKIWITLSIFSTIFLLIGGSVYYFLDKNVRESLAEQILHRQQIAVRSSSIAVHGFFETVEKSMIFMSKEQDLLSFNTDSQNIMDRYIDEWEDTPIASIIQINTKGDIIRSSDDKNGLLGVEVNVSDREYFQLAMQKKENDEEKVIFADPFIAKDVGGYKDAFILPMAIPMFENGEIKGVFAVGISVSHLKEEYLNPLKISENSQIYFINEKGTFISSYFPELMGKNIDEVLQGTDFPEKEDFISLIKDRLGTKEEGKFNVTLPSEFNKLTNYRKMLFSYSPIDCGDGMGYLAIGTPLKHIDYYINPTSNIYSFAVFALVFYMIISTVISLLIFRVIQKIAYFEGYSKAKKEE